ncbi:ATP synthase mitochondrial F1 complex assembly factor 1-like [Saccostrea echinata]|uniref:ATP synthase mitochondrial F1 complex assembly factor 1-like n=1 Tax=Saccostrea echinata TaxID=191078 RepID=UPI002A809C19|nr:ATP synthase mitochondrial F1 complex assembly factor 1-like [Saccostrea echinata]
MNYNIDTAMLPRYNFLRICLSCWSPMSSVTRIPAKWWNKGYKFPMVTCSQVCGLRWVQATHKQYCSSNSNPGTKVEENPYYEKYKAKLQNLKQSDPERYAAKLKEIEEKEREKLEQMKKDLSTPPDTDKETLNNDGDSQKFSGSWPPKSLNEIMKVDLIKDKSASEIEQIWKEHHVTKDCIFGVVQGGNFDDVRHKAQLCPLFIYPLPRNDGYEFILSQFDGSVIYFTPLAVYQSLKENAPPCLIVAHFTEFKEDKGIVLMAGQYDDKILTKNESLNLMKQMSIYYGKSSTDKYNAVRVFNHLPEKFNYLDMIENYKFMKEDLENYYT